VAVIRPAMSADPGQPPPDGDNAGRPNLNRLSGQYSAPPGPNGHGSPAPEARHMKDLQAEARRRVAQLSSSSVRAKIRRLPPARD
jgi:hypothetical protein